MFTDEEDTTSSHSVASAYHPQNENIEIVDQTCYIIGMWRNNTQEAVMTKTTAVRARIEPDLKERAEVILGRHGLSHSTFITMAYNAVVNQGTVPLTFHEPNDALAADIRESRRAFAAGEVK
ncbi:MAG: type II toxin-antitoxin system RelB/DinJ family antitoxin, partial [Alphaproteobacteria bacterium]